jgi:hypothetical protein
MLKGAIVSHRKERLASYLRQELDELNTLKVLGDLSGLCCVADNGFYELKPVSQFDSDSYLLAAQGVLHEDYLGPFPPSSSFQINSVRPIGINEARHLRSKSAGTVRPTDWPPPGLSSFGVSALLFLQYAADVPVSLFASVHQVAHEVLLHDLRSVRLPDDGLLGREWIVPWTTIADSVVFYLAYRMAGHEAVADSFGDFVRKLAEAIGLGFSLDDQENTSGELIAIAG